MQNQNPEIEEKCYKNSQGHYVPESVMKPVDIMRDELVKALVKDARHLQQQLAEFKSKAMSELNAFVELSHEQYGVKRSGQKGNLQLLSFDGQLKVVIRNQDYVTFDERIGAAKELFDQCLAKWSKKAGPEIKTLVDRVFRTDRQGNIRTRDVLDLKNLNFEDEAWQAGIKALLDSIQVAGSTLYINFYERIGETDQWKHISLDLASV